MKILIIEDEKDLREVMTRSLEKERFVVETAADYSTALQKINDYDYDCILLDIMLPGGSGLSILEELKKLKKRESVIIVSAKDSIEDKVTGLTSVPMITSRNLPLGRIARKSEIRDPTTPNGWKHRDRS